MASLLVFHVFRSTVRINLWSVENGDLVVAPLMPSETWANGSRRVRFIGGIKHSSLHGEWINKGILFSRNQIQVEEAPNTKAPARMSLVPPRR